MPVFTPETLAAWTSGKWTSLPSSPLTGYTTDTRQLRNGQVFVALKTDKRDGHDFLATAQTAGASAALVARANPDIALPQLVVADPLLAFQAIAREHRRTFRGPVIGISGSAGKTSTKNLLALLLGGEAGGVLATEGNLNNHLGVPLTLTRIDPERHQFAVIEAGISGPGEMEVLAGMIEPDFGIITLVAPAHLQELGGIEGVAQAKAALLAGVRTGGSALFPQSCLAFEAFRSLKANTWRLGRADIALQSDLPPANTFFTLIQCAEETLIAMRDSVTGKALNFALRRVSDGMAQNAALAIRAALLLGVRADTIRERLTHWQPAALRGELRHEDGRLLYIDCYNANPAAMGDALDAFYALAPETEPRLLVIGCMGELGADSAMYHRALGRSIRLRRTDRLMIIGDDAELVRQGALENGAVAAQVDVVASLDPVRARLDGFKGAVFIKGSRRYQLETILTGEAALAAH
ncbi:UDP-N-acetylmuramoyl-tripeptide--D-alanyl-D-alanine ligase [Rariglobus hedericola]|uniref:UDP-N-acetylmuramoyl-tripeptide--D-alanyl-D-alanine ligase n=1 Tax=Rariglobus hedericola TaxID=2597822 RepID=A0A556QEH9_9BACT|nr:UDP-N-acetylmuramoyl-tripeptide--D-alanyl-D-alanine ligase [Rariglobus hedericola]TSJ75060.1 UDP-N-acetylmuramoyl-tripeptide--D-alanyl-D-alanine ligase [Rariglobus hedericola]